MTTAMLSATLRYDFDDDGRLVAARCKACGLVSVPPRPFHCDKPTERDTLDPVGVVESWTVIRVAPDRFPVPYLLAYVRMVEGPRVLARLETMEEDQLLKGRHVALGLDRETPGIRLKARLI